MLNQRHRGREERKHDELQRTLAALETALTIWSKIAQNDTLSKNARGDPRWKQTAEAGNVHPTATLFGCEAQLLMSQ